MAKEKNGGPLGPPFSFHLTNNLSVLHYSVMTEQLVLKMDMSDLDPKQLVMDFTQRYQEASEEVCNRFKKDKEEYGY